MSLKHLLLVLLASLTVAACGPERVAGASPSDALEAQGGVGSKSQGVQWQANYAEALKLAKQDGKVLMIDFYTDWCSWCKKLDKDVFASPEFAEWALKIVPVKINAEAKPDLARKYKVSGYPNIVFAKSDETVLGRIEGYMPKDDFISAAKQAAGIP